ncbi:ABC transporter permease [Thalassotalea ponticola]|uniref:ABC transporter permease n=1 Tax=Thalassotalea ponticola TaxID=1523392 RepID=UPI0025B4E132|nr:ABC transporter permease [Thalassotalea ponticola]MDN3651883.1 ABC transporter permease [Thalassotalea ponticola]
MVKWARLWAVFKARNLEFFRDKSSLAWNLLFPVLLLTVFAVSFSDQERGVYKVGVIGTTQPPHAFLDTRFITFVPYQDKQKAIVKLEQHELDLLLDFVDTSYWVNELSAKSYLVEKIFVGDSQGFIRYATQGKAIRYVDWVLPGILAMNMMFSSLFGVGYAIVRYRKNAVLKRLKATPLSALEFVGAQLLSRLCIVLTMAIVVYVGCNWLFNFIMLGSYLDLLILAMVGALSLISLGLLIATRSKSEELVGGLLNLATWPMMLLSGVWFSLEGAPAWIKWVAEALPLTHLVRAGRQIMTEGATLLDISASLIWLVIFSAICLVLSALLFNWQSER